MIEPLKFYLITDLHYYDKSLGIEGNAFKKLCDTDQKSLAETGEIIDAYFDKILSDNEIDTVLIAGDLSCNGAMESHLGLVKKLDRLKKCGKKIYVITATHDYFDTVDGTGRAEKCVGDKILSATPTKRDELLDIYKDFGLCDAISVHRESHSYSVNLGKGYRLLCLNDDGDKIHCGYGDSQWKWIENEVNDAKNKGEFVFAMTHHPVLPPTPMYELFSEGNLIYKHNETAEKLANLGVKLVFTGHAHMMNIGKITTEKGNDFYDVNTSSLVGYPSVMRKVILTNEKAQIKSLTIDNFKGLPKNMTVDEFLYPMLHNFLDDIFYSAGYNIPHLAEDLANAISFSPNQVYELKTILSIGGKFINKVTLGSLGYIFFMGKTEDFLKNITIKDFVIEIIENLFYGDEPYTPETPQYKYAEKLFKRIKSLLHFSKHREKISNILDAVLDGAFYDKAPCDWNCTLDFN